MVPDDLGRITEAERISAILSVQHDDCLAYWEIDERRMRARGERLGLQMSRTPMRDFDIADQQQHLPRAVAALAGLRARGHRVYVHCTAGLGRAPLTVLGYLSWIEGCTPEEAIRVILSARPGAVPAWEAYRGSHQALVDEHWHAIECRAYTLYESRQGTPGDADSDWRQAEVEVIRSLLMGMDPDASEIAG
jgi:atypical dual specificity phosphatase